jgi:hypothetical protein
MSDSEFGPAQESASLSENKSGRTQSPRKVVLPGFISEEVGLGDVMKRVTTSVGIRPCGGCQKRAEALNSWIVFSPKR